MDNLTYFKSFDEFEKVYKKYTNEKWPLYYSVTEIIFVYDKENWKWWEKIFYSIFPNQATFYSVSMRKLLPVMKVECLCPTIDAVDIEYIDENGERCGRRVEPENIYYYKEIADKIGH